MTSRKSNSLIKIINNSLIDLPTPINISFWWNTGSLTGLCLLTQLTTGLFLTMHYSNDLTTSFYSVVHIMKDVNNGWVIQSLHANGASMFFICLFAHVGRGIYYSSYFLKETWNIGVILLFLVMTTAYVGYVLPWGQMSFWGATVVTNLLSAIPYLGPPFVEWVWGGFALNSATLTRFFMLHFFTPFLIMGGAMIHLLFLHQTGSNNPLGLNSNFNKIPFHPFFIMKDLLGLSVVLSLLILVCLTSPLLLSDSENFIPANPMLTPTHIQPEWYFLFAYAILRSIPNKLGGVLCLLLSILVLLILPITETLKTPSNKNFFFNQILFWSFTTLLGGLTWIGAWPVEAPFITLGQMASILYFSYFIINPMLKLLSVSLLGYNK